MRTICGWVMVVVVVVCGIGLVGRAEGPVKMELPQRWFYLATNMLVDKNISEAEGLFGRAEGAGYTGILLTDSKLARLDTLDKHYFDNVAKLKADAARHHIEIIPTVFPLGWSNDILGHNPNLAEGMPVKKALFVVKGGEARLEADPAVSLKGGDFGNLKLWQWHDPIVMTDAGIGAGKAARIEANGSNGRVMQTVKVSPWRQYHFSVKVKTKDFKGAVEAKFLVKGAAGGDGGTKSLNFMEWSIKPTQDWTIEHLAFNSQDGTEVMVYVGTWGARSGTAWLAEAKLEEVGLVNVLRRAGTPLVVKKEGGEALVEGKDFAKVVDARMGTVPWPGEYEVWHEVGGIKMMGAAGAEGTRLRVSFYHPVITSTGSVMICLSEPETVGLLRDQAVRVHKLFGAKQYFMAHDEIRCLNWDEACQKRGLEAGEILADNVRTCTKILRAVAPGATIYVWSDMFDPNHNAHKDYYLVHGDLVKSWEGVDKDVVIALWYLEKREASMKFFAGRGNRMIIAGYYDSPVENMSKWLEAAGGQAAGGVVGTMYTTWGHNYKDLEGFEGVVDRYRK